jgi:nucleoid-associated protein YgaU
MNLRYYAIAIVVLCTALALVVYQPQDAEIADVPIIEPEVVDVTRSRTVAVLQPEVVPDTSALDVKVAVARAEPAAHSVGLTGLIMAAKLQGRDESYIQNLLSVAAQSGRLHVPAGMITAEGRLDTQALTKIGEAALGANVALNNRAYTVKPTDSLSGIAYQYYGTTEAALRIFAANKDTLYSADSLTTGQILRLP